jgi:hypothetical protein
MKAIRYHPSKPAIMAAVAVVVAAGGVALAAIPDSSGVIHSCYRNGNGRLRVVESVTDCKKKETAISWNRRGPRGLPGPQGPQGPPGPIRGGGLVYDEAKAEVSTQSDAYVNLGGPSVTVDVPASGLVEVLVRADMKADTAPGSSLPGVGLVRVFASRGDPTPAVLVGGNSPDFERSWTSSGDSGGSVDLEESSISFGTTERFRAAWIALEAPAGSTTFSLQYRSRGRPLEPNPQPIDDTARFRNRKLWVLPIR